MAKLGRRRIALLLAALPLAPLPLARLAAEEQTAEAFLREIYAEHDGPGVRGAAIFGRATLLFTPDLAAAVGDGAFSHNPFTDDPVGQASDVAIKVIAGGDRATGHVTLTRFDRQRIRVTVDMVRLPAGWRIANITWGRGTPYVMSLRRLFHLPAGFQSGLQSGL
jgi:hypothetical protein